MSRLDYLVTKLNLHGVDPMQTPGQSSGSNLSQVDVYGALGMGYLPPIAAVIGLAVYKHPDEAAFKQAKTVAKFEVERIFEKEGWSSTRVFDAQVKSEIEQGILKPGMERTRKLELANYMKMGMAALALDEMIENNICKKCGGTGYIDGKVHEACRGTGKRPHSETYNAQMCFINYDAWLKTWRGRYQVVRSHLIAHLHRFETHLESYA